MISSRSNCTRAADGITAPDIITLTDKACLLTTITRVIQYLTEHTAVNKKAAETFDRELQEQSEEIIGEMMLAATGNRNSWSLSRE